MKPTKDEAQDAVNTIKDLLLTSEIKLHFPLAADLVMDFRLTRKVSPKQFATIMEIIKLAEPACVEATAPAPATDGE